MMKATNPIENVCKCCGTKYYVSDGSYDEGGLCSIECMHDVNIDKEVIAFTKVKLPYGWLGNMSPYSVTIDAVKWPTAEHAFQAMRFSSDSPIRELILKEKNPFAAKLIAKKYAGDMNIVPVSLADWENMEQIVRNKLEQHPELEQQLRETYPKIIYEDCTARGARGNNLFWGAMLKDGQWIGKNILGSIWIQLREELL